MKYFINILFILFTGWAGAQDCKATLTIETDNELAFVIINDSSPVNGKNTTHELTPGTYIITIGENSDRWDARTFYDTIEVKACEKINKSYNFFNNSFLDTEPQDAYVFAADTLVGYTPLIIPVDINRITLRKPGYEDKIVQTADLYNSEKIKLIPVPAERNESFFESPLFLYMSGSLLVFGAVTAYYKLQADDKYTEYTVLGQESLLKETRRLDTISGIAFVALQINFGVLVYYFLSD